MYKRFTYFWPLLIFLAILVLFWYGLGSDPRVLPSNLIGQSLPFQQAETLNNTVILTKDFKGQVTLLNVWASWCPQCQLEQPLLLDIAKTGRVEVYGLNYKDDQQAAKNYLITKGNAYKQVINDPLGKYAGALGVYRTPETFLLDKQGRIRHRYSGPIDLAVLEQDLIPRIKQLQQEQ